MKFVIVTLSIAIASFALQLFLPWWTIALVAFVLAAVSKLELKQAFFSGFIGIGIVWLGYALFLDFGNQHILSDKIAVVFKLPSGVLLLVLSVFIASITGGFAALSGASLRQHF